MGNCKVERAKLSPGFVPMGMKEHGGIIYIASYNPSTRACELGSFPSPERDITGTNKIEGQTGLQNGHFNSSDYSLSTSRGSNFGVFQPNEITSKIQKLNEPEVLQLNPGDMYITTYQFTQGSINDFSFDPNDKRVFSINFYKIDEGNNITQITHSEVKSIAYTGVVDESEYIAYTEGSRGSIAVEVALNSISYFNAAAREVSRKRDAEKEVRIEAVGSTDSAVNFKGVRIDMSSTSDGYTTFHVEKGPASDKLSVGVKDLEDEDDVKIDVTPYTQYGYLPDLMQSFSLRMGQGPSGDNINDVFMWNVNELNSKLELDFDFKFENDGEFKLFLEFYDTWSNVSTMRSVYSPSQYGAMRVIMDLKDEPRTDIFDPYPLSSGTITNFNAQIGGIKQSQLNVTENTIQNPLLINPNINQGLKLIRNDGALRKNHFYIVRLCGYEEIDNNGTTVRKFYDVYRALYTSPVYNDIYQLQSQLSPENPAYQPNFNKIPYPLEKIKYDISLGLPSARNIKADPVEQITEVVPMTEGSMFSITSEPSAERVVFNTKYNMTRNFPINSGISDKYIYNAIKEGIFKVDSSGDEDDPERITVPDTSIIDSNPEDMATEAYLTIPDLTDPDVEKILKLNVNTNRPVKGNWDSEVINGTYNRVYLDSLLFANESSGMAHTICNRLYRASHSILRSAYKYSDNQLRGKQCENIDDGSLWGYSLAMQMFDLTNPASPLSTSTILDTVARAETKQTNITNIPLLNQGAAASKNFFAVAITHFNSFSSGGDNKVVLMAYTRRAPGVGDRVLLFDFNNAGLFSLKNFLSNFYFDKFSLVGNSPNYYITDWEFYSDYNGITELKDLVIDIKNHWDVNSKTYIFEALLRGLGDSEISTFTTDRLNLLIYDAINRSNNEVIEGALEDNGFIPFVTPSTDIEILTQIKLDDEVLNLQSDMPTVRLMEKSRDAFYKYYESSKPDPNAISKIKILGEANATSEQKEFAEIFHYDPNLSGGNLVIDSTVALGDLVYLSCAKKSCKTKISLPDIYKNKLNINSLQNQTSLPRPE